MWPSSVAGRWWERWRNWAPLRDRYTSRDKPGCSRGWRSLLRISPCDPEREESKWANDPNNLKALWSLSQCPIMIYNFKKIVHLWNATTSLFSITISIHGVSDWNTMKKCEGWEARKRKCKYSWLPIVNYYCFFRLSNAWKMNVAVSLLNDGLLLNTLKLLFQLSWVLLDL